MAQADDTATRVLCTIQSGLPILGGVASTLEAAAPPTAAVIDAAASSNRPNPAPTTAPATAPTTALSPMRRRLLQVTGLYIAANSTQSVMDTVPSKMLPLRRGAGRE